MDEGLDYSYEATPESLYDTEIASPSSLNAGTTEQPTLAQFQTYLQQLQEEGVEPEVIDYWIGLWVEQKRREEPESLRKV